MSLRKVLIDPDTMQIKITGFYRALTISERQTAKLKSVAERRIQALMATNEGLYRVLKGMVEAKSLKLWFGWKNTPVSKECQDLLRKVRDRESGITLQNMLDHDWFKKTPGTDALESDGTMQFEGMDSSSAQPSSRSPTDVPAQNNPTVREGKMEDKDLLSDLQDISDSERKTITPESSSLGSGTEEEEGEENEEEESSSQSEGESGSESEGPEHSGVNLRFPHEPTCFRCFYKVGKKVGYDDRVHEGIRRSDGQKVAIKFVERCRFWERSPEFVKEGTTLREMQKPPTCDHSIRLYERFFLKDQTVLVMEHLPAYVPLRKFIRGNRGCLTDETANRIMSQIYVAVLHYKDKDVIYPLLKRFILINPKTLHIKYAHVAEKEFNRILEEIQEETDEVLGMECTALFAMVLHNIDPSWAISPEHVPDAKYYLTTENMADHPLFAEDLDRE
ncbi:uncharacterized protein LOC143752445 isoform X1 [Siphateles boraxobius]|uniref:uncharacterized protein LOC143752445 isoform X1 n=1 Tax=Siphateles boraxobius TaxID=180520 RepID=UPI0040630284